MSRSLSTTFSLPYADEGSVRLFCITFRPHDKILLFPPSLQTAKLLRSIVETNWGLDSHETAPDCYTLNLTGSPFLKHARRENAIMVKYLCCCILDRFKEHGWDLIVCADLSCKTDLTAWYFARSGPRTATSLPPQFRGGGAGDDDASDSGSQSGSISGTVERRSSNAVDLTPPSLVCLSLSKTRKLQLINAPLILQRVLKNLAQSTYAPGLNTDAQRGKHYELKLNGSPWETTNREQLTAACRMLSAIFAEFNERGYRFYGLVNFKETADSIFFEHDLAPMSKRSIASYGSGDLEAPGPQANGDGRFMMVIMDGTSVLRLVGIEPSTVSAVEEAIARFWDGGLVGKPYMVDESDGTRAMANGRSGHDDDGVRLQYAHHLEGVSVDFVLKGSPWLARLSKIGKTRQFVARLLDVLLSEGWTVVTGLDISRGLNSKSALMFESCAPSPNLRHACISPLGKQSLQLVNGPASLRRLIQGEFQRIITAEKTFNDRDQGSGGAGFMDATFEAKLNGFHWDPHPEKDATEYVYTRKQMGALLQRLMDAGWRVVVSADCGHHQEDTDVGEGIHSWFLIFAGNATDAFYVSPHPIAQERAPSAGGAPAPPGGADAAYSMMNVSSRMGRRASAFATTSAAIDAHRRHTIQAPRAVGSPVSRRHRRI